MSNGTQNELDWTLYKKNVVTPTTVETPTYDVQQLVWSLYKEQTKEPEIRKAVGFGASFLDGFTEDMTFGLIDMAEDGDVYATKAGSAGQFGGMFTSMMLQAAALSAVSFGVGGVALFTARSAKIVSAAKKYNAAKKAYQAQKISKAQLIKKQSDALKNSGVGIPNSKLFGKNVSIHTTQRMYLDKFMRLAETDINSARRMVLGTEMMREGTVNAAIGQKFITEENLGREVTAADRLQYGVQDLLAGGFFGAGRAHGFTQALPEMSKLPGGKYGLYFASGFTQALPQKLDADEESNIGDNLPARFGMAAVSAVLGRFARGGMVTEAVDDVQRGMRRIGADESTIADVTDMSLRIALKDGVEQISKDFTGMLYKSIDENKDVIITRVKADGKGGKKKFYVDYDVIDKSQDNKVLSSKTVEADKFFQRHKKPDQKLIDQIKNNLNADNTTSSFFKNQKEVKQFLSTQKYGILTAENPTNINFQGLGDYKPNAKHSPSELLFSEQNDFLIRELLERGYKREDIMSVKGVWKGGGENSFIVKNLKKKDALDLMKIFGQQEVAMNDGYYRLMKNKTTGKLEFSSTKNLDKTKVGARAQFQRNGEAADFYSTADLKNGKQAAFRVEYDVKGFDDDGNLIFNNPSYGMQGVSSKLLASQVDNALNEAVDRYYKRYRTTDARKDKIYQIKQMEFDLKLADEKNPLKNLGAKSFKEVLFGTESLTGMSSKQLDLYASLLSGKEDAFGKRYKRGDFQAFGEIPEQISKVSSFLNNYTLPIVTKFRNFAKKTNSPSLNKLASDLENYAVRKYSNEGKYQAMRDRQKEIYAEHNLTKKEINELDEVLGDFIEEGDIAKLRKDYSNKPHMVAAINKAVAAHKGYTSEIVNLLKKRGVQEFYYNKKTKQLELRPLTVEENFVSRQITEEAAEYFSSISGDARQEIINQIILRDKRFLGNGEYARLPRSQQEEIADLLFGVAQPNNAKYGVYGQQFARTTDLPPYLYIDKQGRVIQNVDSFDYVKGSKIGDVEVDKVIKVYDRNYAGNMDRYASKVANLESFSYYFGNKGIFDFKSEKNVREFNKLFKQRLDTILREVQNPNDRKKIQEALEYDFKTLLGGNHVDEAVNQWYSAITSWTAATGLSSPRSALKNLLLGNVQLYTTFGAKPLLKTWFNFIFDSSARKEMFDMAQGINALQVGQRGLETAIQKTGTSGKVQRGLTKLMGLAEQTNRTVSVATGTTMAEDALRVLTGKKAGMFNMSKTEAQRLLRETLELDDIGDAIKRGSFTNAQKQKIRFMSHSTTQGLADPVFVPSWMSNRYVKPLTLFYRIAYRVTENVYKNAYKPAVRGDVGPMMRYVAASSAAGYSLQTLYHTVFNTEPEKFENAGSRFWQSFIDGEGLGVFSTLQQVSRDSSQFYTPAIIQFGQNLYGSVKRLAIDVPLSNTEAERNANIKIATRDLTTSVPLVNDILKTITNNSEEFYIPGLTQPKKSYQEMLNFRTQVRSYDENVRRINPPSGFSFDEEKSFMYRQIEANVYANRPMEQKVKDFYASVSYLQHQLELTGLYTKNQAYKIAYDKTMRYVMYHSQPVESRLSSESKGKITSFKDDFTGRLDDESKLSLKELEKLHRKNSREYRSAVRNAKNKYRP